MRFLRAKNRPISNAQKNSRSESIVCREAPARRPPLQSRPSLPTGRLLASRRAVLELPAVAQPLPAGRPPDLLSSEIDASWDVRVLDPSILLLTNWLLSSVLSSRVGGYCTEYRFWVGWLLEGHAELLGENSRTSRLRD